MDSSSEGSSSNAQIHLDKALAVLDGYQIDQDREQEIREGIRTVTRQLEKTFKNINFTVQKIHMDPSDENLRAVALTVKDEAETQIKPLMVELHAKVPPREYHKYIDCFRGTLQRTAYLAVVSNYFQNGTLSSISETADFIGLISVIDKTEQHNIYLEYDDYIAALLDLGSELSRFARNCVSFDGSIKRVYDIRQTLIRLSTSLHNISFKNDFLRRRYDSLKYNVKNIEEVMFDLKICTIRKDMKDLSVPASSD